jgi:hypothetical protein
MIKMCDKRVSLPPLEEIMTTASKEEVLRRFKQEQIAASWLQEAKYLDLNKNRDLVVLRYK